MIIKYKPGGEDDDRIDIYEAAEIWYSSGQDEDYMFGYTAKELEEAYNE